jgi:hypothetical protein
MAKQSKKKPKPQPKALKVRDPERIARRRRAALHVLGFILMAGFLAGGFYILRQYVARDVAFEATPPKVVLMNRPAWMSDFLAEQITRAIRPQGGHSALNREMPRDVVEMLRQDEHIAPWIVKVNQVRLVFGQKPGDTLEVSCEYRVPVALVRSHDAYYLVDERGVLLPEHYTDKQLERIIFGRDGQVNIRVVQGVRSGRPARAGLVWGGEDLSSGLDLVKLLHGLPYAKDITRVDVSNFKGRQNPQAAQLVLITRYNTQVQWGRPINAQDFFVEVSPAEKLRHMRDIFQQYGRVDAGHPWVDLRFDNVTYPADAQADGR